MLRTTDGTRYLAGSGPSGAVPEESAERVAEQFLARCRYVLAQLLHCVPHLAWGLNIPTLWGIVRVHHLLFAASAGNNNNGFWFCLYSLQSALPTGVEARMEPVHRLCQPSAEPVAWPTAAVTSVLCCQYSLFYPANCTTMGFLTDCCSSSTVVFLMGM